MATGTKAALDAHIASFHENVGNEAWDSALKDLLKAEATLQTLPSTDRSQYAGTLTRCWDLLERLRSSTSGPKKMLLRRGRGR